MTSAIATRFSLCDRVQSVLCDPDLGCGWTDYCENSNEPLNLACAKYRGNSDLCPFCTCIREQENWSLRDRGVAETGTTRFACKFFGILASPAGFDPAFAP
jgi:hypothetical protein